MSPNQVLDDLKSKIPVSTNLRDALVIFMKHFDETKVEGCSKTDDGDMLLFEWGGHILGILTFQLV